MDGTDIAIADHNGIVNGIHSLIKDISVKVGDKKVYDCSDVNHSVNIKNLLEYSDSYAETTAANEFYYLDTSREAEERTAQAASSEGFHKRKTVLGASSVVNFELPLNRYSLFETLEDKLLPQTRIEILFDLASDNQVIWQAADDCRVIFTKMQLVVPQITFNAEGQSLYASTYLKPQKWTYLKETVSRSNSTQDQTGNYVINSGETKPRHVFVFFINDANIDEQTANPFLYNTFSVSTNPRTLSDCFLEVSNGVEYPDRHYEPDTDLTRVSRDILKYVHANNEYSQGTLLNRNNFLSLYQFIYFV